MAGEENKKFDAEPNFKWPPERYYKLASYVLMFNGIANSHDDYGIENSNGDQEINRYINEHLEELLAMREYDVIAHPKGMPKPPLLPAHKPGISQAAYDELLEKGGYNAKTEKYKTDLKAWQDVDDYVNDDTKSPELNAKLKEKIKKERAAEYANYQKQVKELRSDLPNLVAMAKEYCRKANYDGKYISNMLTNEQMGEILRAKYDAVRNWHEDVRKHVKGKSGKKDKDGQFDQWHDWDNAQAERLNKNKIVRRNGWRTFRRIAATALFGAVTLASVGALLSYGGFALTAMFGTAFNASGVSGAVLGFIGTVAGGTFTKRFFGRFLDSMNEGRKLRRDRREFMRSFGKYSDKIEPGKTRQARGFRNIKQRYYESLAIMNFLEKGKLDTTVKKGLKGKELREARAKARLNKKLQVYLNRGIKRGTISNPFADGGEPLDLSQLEKESRFYKFVTDKSDKQPYGFDHILAKLGAAKSMNVNDVHSVQAHTVIAEEALADNSISIVALKDKLEELKRGESKFADDNKDKYQELMYRFSDRLIEAFRRDLFKNPYTHTTVSDATDFAENETIKTCITNPRNSTEKDAVDNAIRFVKLESESRFEPLNTSIGVSVENQMSFNVSALMNGVAGLGVESTDSEYSAITGIASRIQSATTQEECDVILNDVKSIANTGVKDYFEFMATKKKKSSRVDKKTIDSSVPDSRLAKMISDITIENCSDVRIEIMKSSLTPDQKKKAIEVMEQQVDALDTKERFDTSSGIIDVIKENNIADFDEIAKMISDIKTINASDYFATYERVKKLRPDKLKKYFMLKLQDKALKNFTQESTETGKYTGTGDDVLKNITTTLTSIEKFGSSGYLSPSLKAKAVKLFEKFIENAVNVKMDKAKREFALEEYDTEVFNKILVESYSTGNGLREYFETQTTASNNLKDKLEYMRTLGTVHNLLKVKTDGQDQKETANEARAFSAIYFKKERDNGDTLFKMLQTLENITTRTTNIEEFVSTTDFEELDFIKSMKKEIGAIDAWTDEEDKFAALLVLKKRCLGMYKNHAKQYLSSNNVTDFATYMNTPLNKKDFEDKVFKQWVYDDATGKGLLNLIDEKLAQIVSDPKYAKLTYTSAQMSAQESYGPRTVVSYLQGPQL